MHCSKLARGNFNGVDTKYEHQVGRVTKKKQRYFGMRMFSVRYLWFPLVSGLYNFTCCEIENPT